MARPSRYSPEVRERAVRMVFQSEREHASQWAAILSIASKMGCTPETLRTWVRRVEVDTRRRGGLTSEDRTRIRELERESFELRRARSFARRPLFSPRRSSTGDRSDDDVIDEHRDDYEIKPIFASPIASSTTATVACAPANSVHGEVGSGDRTVGGQRRGAYDNVLAETIIGPYKTVLIEQLRPWRNVTAVELETLGWVDWFNNRRLLEPIGDIPPAEFEAMYDQLEARLVAVAGLK